MSRTVSLIAAASFAIMAAQPNAARADDAGWKSVGARVSLSATPNGTFYHQYEVSTVYQLSWNWRNGAGWGVGSQVEGTAGVLRGQQTNAFIGSIGPDLTFGKAGGALEVAGGVNIALLSTPKFGKESFEGDAQFISHIGLNCRFIKRLGVGYRFQHMSNAGMYGGFNPGLNVHMVVLDYYLDGH